MRAADLPRPDAASTWHASHPTAVALTLSRLRRGVPDPTHRTVDTTSADRADLGTGALWKTTLTDDGPATMLLTQTDLRTVTCRAWGPAR